MAYTILDLLKNLIDIEQDALNIYLKIEEKSKNNSHKVAIIAKAIAKQEQKHIEYYEKLMKDLDGKLEETIDFYSYDKAAKLLFEFKNRILPPEITNPKDLIQFALEFEKNNIGLLLDVQGRLLVDKNHVHNGIYKVISRIIAEEQGHEKMFQELLNRMN